MSVLIRMVDIKIKTIVHHVSQISEESWLKKKESEKKTLIK